MNRIIRFLKLLKLAWWATENKNDHIFIYGTRSQVLINKFMKLIEKRDNQLIEQ